MRIKSDKANNEKENVAESIRQLASKTLQISQSFLMIAHDKDGALIVIKQVKKKDEARLVMEAKSYLQLLEETMMQDVKNLFSDSGNLTEGHGDDLNYMG